MISPVLSNLYLNEVDKMLEKAKEVTRNSKWTRIEYARFADDLVILIDGHPRQRWLLNAVNRRLREELAKLHVELNEEKSRIVDLAEGGTFSFLGFDFRRIRSRQGKWRPNKTPKPKKRTALLRRLKEIFHRLRSQPVTWVIEQINPILRGWVRYFRIGNSSDCFSYVRHWVEMKIMRHVLRAQGRRRISWRKWNPSWVYGQLGLFDEYLVRYYVPRPKATPAREAHTP